MAWGLAILLAVLALGGACLSVGLRGRRINDHPVCRKCKFDLDGVYPGVERCPECGVPVSARRVRTGVRRPRTALIVMSIPLVLVGLAGVGAGVWVTTTSTNWYQSAPSWVLERFADSPDAAKQAGAMTELQARLGRGELDEARIDRVVARALALQADRDATWATQSGGFLDAALAAGAMSADQIRSYLVNGISLELVVRDRVRQGDQTQVSLSAPMDRLGSRMGTAQVRFPPIFLDGEQFHPGGGGFGFHLGPGAGRTTASTGAVFDVDPGTYQLTGETELSVTLMGLPPALSESATIVHPLKLSATVRVVAPDASIIEFVDDPSVGEELVGAIRIPQIQIRSDPDEDGRVDIGATLHVTSDLPMPFACEILVRDAEGNLHPWTTKTLRTMVQLGHTGAIQGPLGPTTDVVLRGSESAAHEAPDVERAWSGEIVIENVPVMPLAAEEPGTNADPGD